MKMAGPNRGPLEPTKPLTSYQTVDVIIVGGRVRESPRIQVKRLGLLLSCVVSLSVSTAAGPRSIASLIEEAYQKNPNVHFYEQEIAAAQGDRRIAGTWPNPDLSGQIGGKTYNSLGGRYLGTGPVWTVSLTQTFEFPGRVTLRKAIADKQIALARIGLEQFRLSLRNRSRCFATAYLPLRTGQLSLQTSHNGFAT
jgi:cobalt-zinc-cadmium efflux system outer membrane protein